MKWILVKGQLFLKARGQFFLNARVCVRVRFIKYTYFAFDQNYDEAPH